jgi:hypothetical protein
VAVESRGLAGGRAEHAGFGGLPTKPSENGFLVWASKPSPKAQHDGDGIRACREASKQRTRGGIAWLASGGRGVRRIFPGFYRRFGVVFPVVFFVLVFGAFVLGVIPRI